MSRTAVTRLTTHMVVAVGGGAMTRVGSQAETTRSRRAVASASVAEVLADDLDAGAVRRGRGPSRRVATHPMAGARIAAQVAALVGTRESGYAPASGRS